ncbi:KLHL24 [Symbiodinium natans]|uniref:KLHL24 protein n=1 Tax=Symbiodinium natans TaxID=878477 RepID=A0A812H742_9DINO|nr:KLHL24 [Symbiodinium natans]
MVAVKLEHANLAQHQANVMQQMRDFWMEAHLCDVVLKDNDGAEHRGHTVLLSAASVYFRKLLGGPFQEADRVRRKEPVEIAASKAATSALLDYIYGGQPEVNVETGLELLRLAQAYDLPTFASAIETGLCASLDSVKALRILQESHLLHSLKAACEEKVAEEFEACSKHPDFGKLGARQLARILKREDLAVSREEVVLKGIFNWLKVSDDRKVFLGTLLQHVDFQAFSVENLLRAGRFPLCGPSAAELHQEVEEALQIRQQKRAQSADNSQSFQPKRRCLKHWTPDLGASAETWREVLPVPCNSLCWHEGHIYSADFQGNVFCWKPGDPATSARKVVGQAVGTTGIIDLGACDVAILPTGEILVLDLSNERLVRFQDGCGHLVCDHIDDSQAMFRSPNGVVYLLVEGGKVVQKVVGSTLQTVIASESLPEHLHFRGRAILATKGEVIYITDNLKGWTRVFRFNRAESLEPVVVGEGPWLGAGQSLGPWGLFVAEDETIYVGEHHSRKVLAFHPGNTAPSEVLVCPDALRPVGLVVHHRSLYVSMVDDIDFPTAGGVYEHLLPPELQLE